MPSIVVDIAKDCETLIELFELDTVIPVRVTGTSMLPFLRPDRDVVNLKKYNGEKLCKNQIVLFKTDDGKLVLHRIFDVLDDGFLRMNGDAQISCEVIKTKQVIAVVDKIIRNGSEIDVLSYDLVKKQNVWRKFRLIRPLLIRCYKIFYRS